MMEGTESVEELGVKKVKLLESEDRISALPDSIIHHILSFLPSTKEAIQTCLISKRWKNQWTGVPVLVLDLSSMSDEHASGFVENTLIRHDCSKIKKFHIFRSLNYEDKEYPQLNEIISFAIRKHVEELILDILEYDLILPEIIFTHSSLVRLKACDCYFKPNGRVCWEHLKELDIACCTFDDDDAVDNILRGSPVLESLVLDLCSGIDQLVIVSEYLKKLTLGVRISVLEISCPNLEKLYLLGGFSAETTKLMNLTSLNHATLDFEDYEEMTPEKIFQQLQHVKDLKLGAWVIEFLSCLGLRAGQSLPKLNNKCLTLHRPNFDKHRNGIARALHSSHLLEKLVIIKFFHEVASEPGSEELYGSLTVDSFNCLVSHLKFVDIINLSKRDPDYEQVLAFIEFILMSARVLEKLTVVFEKEEKDFMLEVSMLLLSCTRCSPHATVEFQYFVK